jgi:hypothetical protein
VQAVIEHEPLRTEPARPAKHASGFGEPAMHQKIERGLRSNGHGMDRAVKQMPACQ